MTEIAARFEAKVERIPFMECWIWTGATHERGYGIIGRGAKSMGNERAHRLSYRLYKGEIPEGKIVLHKCGNTYCVNPYHLEVGTQKENVADTIAMGRLRIPDNSGEKAKWAKLTADQVMEIRAARGTGRGIGTALAKRFSVSKSTIYNIWSGDSWQTL